MSNLFVGPPNPSSFVGPASSPSASPLGGSFLVDEYLPAVDWHQFAQEAMDTDGSRFFWLGLYCIGAGLMIRLGLAAHDKWIKGLPAFDWKTPVTHAVFFGVVGLSYPAICENIISFVTSLGFMPTSGDALTEVFARRFAGFLAHQEMNQPPGLLDMLTAEGWKVASLELAVHISYVFTLVAVFVIKGGQLFILKIIVMFGPLLLGAAACGPFFHLLAVAWVWALIEVSAWSITMSVILHTLDTFMRATPDHFTWITEVFISLFTVAMVWGTTKYTGMLVRGESAGSVGMSLAQSMYGGARLASEAAGTSNKYLAGFGGNASVKTANAIVGGMGGALGKGGASLGKFFSKSRGGGAGHQGGGTASGGGGEGGSSVGAAAQRKQEKKAQSPQRKAANRHFAIEMKKKGQGGLKKKGS